jgi:hypothetical protein
VWVVVVVVVVVVVMVACVLEGGLRGIVKELSHFVDQYHQFPEEPERSQGAR